MREIKFRAWDKQKKEMTEIMCLNLNIYSTDHICKSNSHPNGYNQLFENLVLMQYTGLKDKNGKEIYEGDVVKAKFRYDTDKEEKPAKNDTTFEVKYKINPNSQYCGFNLFPSDFNTIEIIGNIHENPELLKEVKE